MTNALPLDQLVWLSHDFVNKFKLIKSFALDIAKRRKTRSEYLHLNINLINKTFNFLLIYEVLWYLLVCSFMFLKTLLHTIK